MVCRSWNPPIMKGNDEAKGYILNSTTRIVLFMTMSYLVIAILNLAYKEVGCTGKGYAIGFNETRNATQTEEEANLMEVECTGKYWGFQPFSLVTTMIGIGQIFTAIFLPIIGALVDYTDKRRKYLVNSFYIFWLSNLAQVFIGEGTWVFMGIIQAFVAPASFMTHIVMTVAYANEIAPKESDMIDMMTAARLWEIGVMIGYLILIAVLQIVVFSDDVVWLSRTAQAIACAMSLPVFMYVAPKFTERPALHKMPEGQNLLTAGFYQVFATAKSLTNTYPMVMRFLVGLAFLDAANSTVLNLMVIYSRDQLKVENTAILVALAGIFTIPGAYFGNLIVKRSGALASLFIIIFFNLVNLAFGLLFVHKPEHSGLILPVSVIFGMTIGATYLVQKIFYLSIIPYGQEAELQGFYSFCSISISFLPSMTATLLETAYNTSRWSLVPIFVCYLIAGIVFKTINTEEAKAAAANANLDLKEEIIEAVRRKSLSGKAAIVPKTTDC